MKPTIGRVAGLRVDLADERPALGVVVLDQRDAARQRALVAGEQALGEGGLRIGHRAATEYDQPRWTPLLEQRPRDAEVRGAPRAAARRSARAAALHARPRDAHLRLRAADRPLGVAEAALARAAADRRAVLRRPRRDVRDRQGARVRLGRWCWIGHGSKIRAHEGEVEIGAKTVIGQECTISAFQHVSDRARVHRRRPRDADRLRPRSRRGRAPDPAAGHLQARRPRRQQLLDRLRRVHPARRHASATTR